MTIVLRRSSISSSLNFFFLTAAGVWGVLASAMAGLTGVVVIVLFLFLSKTAGLVQAGLVIDPFVALTGVVGMSSIGLVY